MRFFLRSTHRGRHIAKASLLREVAGDSLTEGVLHARKLLHLPTAGAPSRGSLSYTNIPAYTAPRAIYYKP